MTMRPYAAYGRWFIMLSRWPDGAGPSTEHLRAQAWGWAVDAPPLERTPATAPCRAGMAHVGAVVIHVLYDRADARRRLCCETEALALRSTGLANNRRAKSYKKILNERTSQSSGRAPHPKK